MMSPGWSKLVLRPKYNVVKNKERLGDVIFGNIDRYHNINRYGSLFLCLHEHRDLLLTRDLMHVYDPIYGKSEFKHSFDINNYFM